MFLLVSTHCVSPWNIVFVGYPFTLNTFESKRFEQLPFDGDVKNFQEMQNMVADDVFTLRQRNVFFIIEILFIDILFLLLGMKPW